jgi:hypothetical protein
MPAMTKTFVPDLIPLAEVCRRLELSEATVKQWHRERGLPIFRVTNGGSARIYAYWPDVVDWFRQQAVK